MKKPISLGIARVRPVVAVLISLGLMLAPVAYTAPRGAADGTGLPEQKPAAPVEITLLPPTVVIVGQPFELQAQIKPLVGADSVEVRFTPATSLVALSSDVVSFASTKAGELLQAGITLKADTGGELRVACTVLLHVDGQTQPRATVITLNVKGTSSLPARKPVGEVKQRANGEKVVVLQ